MQIGILGLGKMGSRLMEKFLREGHEVVAWNRSKNVLDQLKIDKGDYVVKQKLKIVYGIEGLRDALLKPRVFWLMLPAGEATENIINEIVDIAEPGDIIIDGGNAHFKDTQRHFDTLTTKGIKFLGIGVSGGVRGLEEGFCLMAGGDKDGYEYIRPALDSLVVPGGAHNYFGTGGAGHFVKMVHNGIEYGMMQALGEGFGVLEKSPYAFNLLDVGNIYQRGSIVRSFLLDMAVNAFTEDPGFVNTEGVISATGEAKWTIEEARVEHVPVDVIAKSLEFRERSQYDKAVQESFAAKLVAALRKQFGGHAIKNIEK
jgi:6-phosphogluconate dehydrogenase